MSNAPGVETQAANIFNQRFFLHSEETIRTQVFPPTTEPDGRYFRGPFLNTAMIFEYENQDLEDSLTVEILAAFDFDNRDRQIGITGGNVEQTEVDATTTWDSIASDVVVPLGRSRRIVDWPTLTNARSPDALRLRITSGTGTMLVDVTQGHI
ncbi:hypothetical protein LCGC14_0583880 [marine sediment metagenome]|uniref:Uncharacterized protein n=1 Tax=marine sediment metagenome TaxID=412755 RepID=A0A0F9RZD1_9ZZZZ